MGRAVEEVANGVWVATSRRDTTTSTVIERAGGALLVDPAWDPDELDGIADLIDGSDLRVIAGIATHAHHDHLLWHPRFGDVPRHASPETAELAAEHRDQLVAALGADWPADLAALVGEVDVLPANVMMFAGERIEFVVHDAHVPGHTAVWLPERRVLLAGDMLSDIELPLPFDPDDIDAYRRGLDALVPYVVQARVLVPGHGHPTERPTQRLYADLRYLEEIAAGRDPDDPRRANPGMSEVHERLKSLAVRGGSTPR